jgi:hypothetical protein
LKFRIFTYTFIFFSIISIKVFGTKQIPDILIWNGDTVSLFSNPLEQLFKIDSLRINLFGNSKNCSTTDCWRNYQAEWTIIDNQLYLTNIFSCCFYEDKIKADLKTLFNESYKDGKINAKWVTGNLIGSKGKFLFYSIANEYSVYEGQTVLTIKNGELVETKSYDNSKSKQSEYTYNEEKLIKFIYTNIAWQNLPKLDKTIRVYVRFSANEKGIIDSVKVMKGYDEIFDSEAKRVVKTIPEWETIYNLGQPERKNWDLPIIFSEENRKKYMK